VDAAPSEGGAGDAVRAADVFVADLRPRPGGRLMQGVRLAGAALSELLLQLIPAPSVHDVVVARRDDGTEVLRVPAGDPHVPGDMLRLVQRQLAEQDLPTFLAGWGPTGRT
jgi:hypothetical protein